MIFSNITRNGMLSLTFNQEILVPSFIGTGGNGFSNTLRRNLLAIDKIDVSQIVSLNFVLKSEVKPDDIKYSLELQKWTDKSI